MDMVAGRVWADERRPIRHVDWFLLLLTGALVVVGLFLLYSATASTLRGESLDPFVRVKKQAITAILGLVIVLVDRDVRLSLLQGVRGVHLPRDGRRARARPLPGIGATDTTGTAQRWFAFAGFQITPSEFAKIAVIVMLAAVLSELRSPEPTLSDLVKVLAVAAVPMVLVFIQPDIGTTIVLAAIVVGILVVAGTRLKHLLDADRGRTHLDLPRVPTRGDQGLPAGTAHGVPRSGRTLPKTPGTTSTNHEIAVGSGGIVRAGLPERDADEPGLRAGAAHRLHLHRGGGGVRVRRRDVRPARCSP